MKTRTVKLKLVETQTVRIRASEWQRPSVRHSKLMIDHREKWIIGSPDDVPVFEYEGKPYFDTATEGSRERKWTFAVDFVPLDVTNMQLKGEVSGTYWPLLFPSATNQATLKTSYSQVKKMATENGRNNGYALDPVMVKAVTNLISRIEF